MAKTEAQYVYVFAHGAGAGMNHPFMERAAEALAARGIATHRYEFPYMQAKKSRPDPPSVAEAAVRKAVAEAARQHSGLPIFAGGKSFGGRMTSQAQAAQPMPGVRGLIFFGFPLHAPGRPSTTRADHLTSVDVPMLFLQGTRDEFAQLDLLREVVGRLGRRATLHLIEEGDHSFKVPKRTGKTESDVMNELADTVRQWAMRGDDA
ncbi:MAG TPA: alpha/beta family hydrolase [Gemmatimonadales bacterium]|nr:alpha/beta family hydrolase [Gemmatimonadales bacterium]